MPDLPHLILPRAEVNLDRRKKPGFGKSLSRDHQQQSQKLAKAVDEALASHAALRATIVDPELIVRVRTTHLVSEEEWTRAGLVVLGHDENDSVVLFSSDIELTEFRARLAAYANGIPEGQKNPQYVSLLAAIEELGPLTPADRIGSTLKADGYVGPDAFAPTAFFRLDVELWEFGTQVERRIQSEQMEIQLRERGGDITDRYIGTSFTALRVAGTGAAFQWLLTLPTVRVIDAPPEVDSEVEQLLETDIRELGEISAAKPDAPVIGIIDSGVNSAHPVLSAVVSEAAGFPASLGASDAWGHGTKVCGIAAFGDVRDCLERNQFAAQVHLFSGKVVNDQGNFDDQKLVSSQMSDVIRDFHAKGCRIFNLSLGDRNALYAGGKVGMWTAVLDELARELDILIVVAAGNYEHVPPVGRSEDHLLGYPRYLLEPKSRLLEPAVGANVLAVGAVAHAAAVPNQGARNVSIRPIADIGEPAPFTRCGPGVHDAIKPDLCDDGGNVLYDGLTQGLSTYSESEVLTTHPRYLERLFTTAKGTSYAAPLVSHKAALLLEVFPEASANLLRALLVNSARPPDSAVQRLQTLGSSAVRNLCGYGVVNFTLASTSDSNRVVLYADDEIGLDRFFVYKVPIPKEFTETKGSRAIRVTLAFDPPTRHTRAAYLGVEMSFRLVRGKTLAEVIDHYKKRDKQIDGEHPQLEGRYDCGFDFGSNMRECGTLQSARFTMSRNPATEYGEEYYLVVRCERKWFADDFAKQRFAVVVELSHSEDIKLYERVRERVEVRVRV
jgi:subtilisin family serine protease